MPHDGESDGHTPGAPTRQADPPRRRWRTRLALVAVLAGPLALMFAGTAHAAAPTTPVGSLVQQATSTAGDVATTVTSTVDQVASTVRDTAAPVLDQVTKAANDVVDTVKGTASPIVDDLTGTSGSGPTSWRAHRPVSAARRAVTVKPLPTTNAVARSAGSTRVPGPARPLPQVPGGPAPLLPPVAGEPGGATGLPLWGALALLTAAFMLSSPTGRWRMRPLITGPPWPAFAPSVERPG